MAAPIAMPKLKVLTSFWVNICHTSLVVYGRYQCWCALHTRVFVSVSISESISNVHRGYFRLVYANWLNSSELAVPLLTGWCSKRSSWRWSSVALRYLARGNAVFAVELLNCSSSVSCHLLLQGDWQLSISPPSLSVSSLIWSCCCHCLRRSLFGGSVSNLSHSLLVLNIWAAHPIINDLLAKHRSIFFSLHYEIFSIAS